MNYIKYHSKVIMYEKFSSFQSKSSYIKHQYYITMSYTKTILLTLPLFKNRIMRLDRKKYKTEFKGS